MLASSLPAPALGGLARLARRGLSVGASAASAATTDIPFALPSRLFGESADRPVIRSVDCHCAGLPARIVLGGAPMPAGESSYERRHHVMHEQDWVRKLMITEPRGYPCQNVNIICHKQKATAPTVVPTPTVAPTALPTFQPTTNKSFSTLTPSVAPSLPWLEQWGVNADCFDTRRHEPQDLEECLEAYQSASGMVYNGTKNSIESNSFPSRCGAVPRADLLLGPNGFSLQVLLQH